MADDDGSLSSALSQIASLQGEIASVRADLEKLEGKRGGVDMQQISDMMAGVARDAVRDGFSKFTIQCSTPLRASGSGYNITITSEPVLPRVLTGQAVCQGDGTVVFTFQG